MTHSNPFNHHEDRYPYAEHHACGAHCTMACNHTPPPPVHPQTPTGWVKENKFRIVDGYPYLVDMPMLKWGPKVRTSEQLETKVVQRREISCVRLDAVFDCTTSMSTNTTLRNYFKQIIERKYLPLDGILPIIQEWTSFKLNYHVESMMGDTVLDNSAVVSIKEGFCHLTDVRDLTLTSFKGIFMVDIPDLTQYGSERYVLVLDSIEVYVTGFNTLEYLDDPALNPFYAFAENYTRIDISHEAVSKIDPDYPKMIITEIPLRKTYAFDAAVTTRLKLAFTAYLSDLILSGNTFDVWSALTQPTDAIIAQMKTDLDTMNERLQTLNVTVENQNVTIANLVEVNTQQNEQIETLTTTVEDLVKRVEALENPDAPPSDKDPSDPPSTDPEKPGNDKPGTDEPGTDKPSTGGDVTDPEDPGSSGPTPDPNPNPDGPDSSDTDPEGPDKDNPSTGEPTGPSTGEGDENGGGTNPDESTPGAGGNTEDPNPDPGAEGQDPVVPPSGEEGGAAGGAGTEDQPVEGETSNG